jgi:hypothetical protein
LLDDIRRRRVPFVSIDWPAPCRAS